MERTNRLMTSAKVAQTLSQAGIPALGPNKLRLLSRRGGNSFTRDNGTQVVIFNVLAFRGSKEQKAAQASWIKGTKLEKAGDVEGAQEHYRAAYNQLMAFSVLAENAPAFTGIFEVAGIVENVPAGAELQAQGIATVLGFNSPSPVAIVSNVSSSAALFSIDAIDDDTAKPATPPTMPSGLTPTQQKAWKKANGVAA